MASGSVAANSSEECKDEDALNSTLRPCANDPDFAVICAFFQKFSKDLGIDVPNFKLLQEWLTDTNEVSVSLRDLHIKLLRKTRRTVHEKSWESALSKFCFSYSLQDAWEIERFTYKNSSLKVKLRILRELLESQFERNAKLRSKVLSQSANSLRSEPIGRDRHGHAYWLTQDNDCNLRIYQEHLDEEIWQVVATSREELVNLIARLRGNEVVLPSTDIGAIDEDSSSNSCSAAFEKQPPPEEKEDDSQDEAKVPNIKIKLNNNTRENHIEKTQAGPPIENMPSLISAESKSKENNKAPEEKKVKPLIITQNKGRTASPSPTISTSTKKRNFDELDKSSHTIYVQQTVKKARPLLMDSKPVKNQSKYPREASEDDVESEEDDPIDEEECEEEDIDSAAADTCEHDEKEIEDNDYEDNSGAIVGETIDDPLVFVSGPGSGKDCEGANIESESINNIAILSEHFFDATESMVSEIVEDDVFYVIGLGDGVLNLVGNNESSKKDDEPKATFFFGEPGCLKLSPIKVASKSETDKKSQEESKKTNDKEVTNEKYVENFEDASKTEKNGATNESLKGTEKINMIEAINEDKEKSLGTEQNSLKNKSISCKSGRKSDENNEISKKEENQSKIEFTSSSTNSECKANTSVKNCERAEKEHENYEENCVKRQNNDNEEGYSALGNVKNIISNDGDGKDNTSKANKDKANITVKPTLSNTKSTDDETGVDCHTTEQENREKQENREVRAVNTPTKLIKKNSPRPDTILPNRKRRLVELSAFISQKQQQGSSESEIDLNSEQLPEDFAENDLIETDIGGKRLKMRCKLTNTELRRKVEEKILAGNDETTSSSGEEDQRRCRNTATTKRIYDKASTSTEYSKNLKQNNRVIQKTVGKTKLTLEEIIENKIKRIPDEEVDEKMSAITVSPTKKFPITKPLKKNLLTKLRNPGSEDETIPRKRAISETANEIEVAEVSQLEKGSNSKGNTIEKSHPQVNKEDDSDSAQIDNVKIKKDERRCSQGQDIEEHNYENSTIKHTTGEGQDTQDDHMDGKSNKEISINVHKRKSSPYKNNLKVEEDKVGETKSLIEIKVEPRDETVMSSESPYSEFKTVECQRKRRSSGEINKNETNTNPIDDLKTEKLSKTTETNQTDIKKYSSTLLKEHVKTEEKTQTAPVEPIGRRSGRRNANLVVYAELPQPKRTRPGVTIVPPKVNNKKALNMKRESIATVSTPTNTKVTAKKDQNKVVHSKTRTVKVGTAPIKKETAKEITSTTSSAEGASYLTKPGKSKTTAKLEKSTPINSTKVDNSKNSKCTTGTRTTGVGRTKLEVDTSNIIVQESDTPVRQSRRIAQQKIREEAERRKLEEIALRTMKQELKKKKIAEKETDPTVTLPSEDSSSSASLSSATEASAFEKKKKRKKKRPGKDGAWSSGSEEQEEPEEEDEEPAHYSDPGSPLFRSDHEFSPESDLEDDSQIVPLKRARTARKEDADESEMAKDEEEACQKCGKSDHPEWILLCDKCDKGYHCSCLSPVLFYIPEGDWFCPPCQQEQLIDALERQLQVFDMLVERKRLEEEEENIRKAKAAEEERERLKAEMLKKDQKKYGKSNSKRNRNIDYNQDYGSYDDERNDSGEDSFDSSSTDDDVLVKEMKINRNLNDNSSVAKDDDDNGDADTKRKGKKKSSRRDKKPSYADNLSKRCRGDRRIRRKAAKRCDRQRRRNESSSADNESGSSSTSDDSGSSGSSTADSDDEPIYKLRKRRQINVSYRLNEYDHLIDSALKKEMDEAAGAGNLGRGKDITTIIEADKEEKAKNQTVDGDSDNTKGPNVSTSKMNTTPSENTADDCEEMPIKNKSTSKNSLKKKARKLTTLDISSEEDDNGSDEDFKTFSAEDEDDDTSISVSTNSDSSLEVYRRRKSNKKNQRKAARRSARERRKDRKFVVDDSFDDEDDIPLKSRTKKKKKSDSDFTETDIDEDELSELSDNLNSSDLCDDSSSNDSDGAWCPSKSSKKRKANVKVLPKVENVKIPQVKKAKRLEYSDDDLSESEEETEDEEDDVVGSGKGSGKQPRSQPSKPSTKPKQKPSQISSKHFSDDDPDSLSDSGDRRTRGKRYAYIEDFDDESSDGGIKPGVKRPDTPPEERQKFIEKQEEIKRMLAEKNAEGAKLAATPRLTPIKAAAANEKQSRSPAKTGAGDALSAVPLSVIRQAKVLDIDYLQRKGESLDNVLDNVDDVDSEFDDADLPDELPEDMDEDTIARMVEEEEELSAVGGTRDLSSSDKKSRDHEKTTATIIRNPAVSQVPTVCSQIVSVANNTSTPSVLQEPMRKRLPMPTMHPPLLRHQFHHPSDHLSPVHLMHRPTTTQAPMHLLQNALSAPIGQPLLGNFPNEVHQRLPNVGDPPRPMAAVIRTGLPQQVISAGPVASTDVPETTVETKPRRRRKKITPLRDPMQKQQAAAAVAAAANAIANDKKAEVVFTTKQQPISSSTSSLKIAQPPQLFATTTISSTENQPSVITRMPSMTQGDAGVRPTAGIRLPSPGVAISYPPAPTDMTRFYNPAAISAQRMLRPPGALAGMAPHGSMRPTYGPPPLHGISQNSGGGPATNLSRSHVAGHPVSSVYASGVPPPPARHATSHLNPFRPPIFGNPSYQRGTLSKSESNLRGATGGNYGVGSRGYSPYAYFPPPPPPPLTAQDHQHQSSSQHQTTPSLTNATTAIQPSSVIVAAPNISNVSTTSPPTLANNLPTNHSVSSITRSKSPTPPPAHEEPVTPLRNTPPTTGVANLNNTSAVDVSPADAQLESRNKLTTLETYTTVGVVKRIKSPLQALPNSESSNLESHGSSVTAPDIEDSSLALGTTVLQNTATGDTPASEFSGLVSYFSSQHDDYNS